MDELMTVCGWPLGTVKKFWCCRGPVRHTQIVYPCSTVWSMGFSWSSAVAQEVTVGMLLQSGFPSHRIICDSEELPFSSANVAVVATDDTIFIGNDRGEQEARFKSFD